MRQTGANVASEAETLLAVPEPEVFARALGERIALFRERRGWSRADLARRLGVNRDRLAKWELGKHPPPLEMLAVLGKELGVSLDELVTGEPAVQGRLTPKQYEDLLLLVEAARKVLREPGSVSLPGGDAQGGTL